MTAFFQMIDGLVVKEHPVNWKEAIFCLTF